MIRHLYNLKFIFHIANFLLIFLYLFPGSFLGCFFFKNCIKQPQLTQDFIVSSNHVYAFLVLTILGLFAYFGENKFKIIILYLFLVSILLETLHLLIPNRGFEFGDLFGNILGVLFSLLLFKFYKYLKKS